MIGVEFVHVGPFIVGRRDFHEHATAGAQHPVEFVQREQRIRAVLQGMPAPDEINALILIGQIGHAGHYGPQPMIHTGRMIFRAQGHARDIQIAKVSCGPDEHTGTTTYVQNAGRSIRYHVGQETLGQLRYDVIMETALLFLIHRAQGALLILLEFRVIHALTN